VSARFPLAISATRSTSCQSRRTISARIAPGSLRVTAGEELIRSYDPDDGFSKVFCSACGSALWSQSPDDPEVKGVRLGAFDGDPGARPEYHQFVAFAAPWEPIPADGLPCYPESRPR
jgi:hypothetical protein